MGGGRELVRVLLPNFEIRINKSTHIYISDYYFGYCLGYGTRV